MPITHQTIPISLLKAHPRNYRKHPDSQLANLQQSLKAYDGQVRSIVVSPNADGTYTILAGHGITQAAQNNGLQFMECDVIPADWPEVKKLAYIASDNQAGFEDDTQALAELLEEVKNSDVGIALEAMGQSQESLDSLLEEVATEVDRNTRSLELKEPEGGEIVAAFNVLVECASESEQEAAFTLLKESGYKCKPLTL